MTEINSASRVSPVYQLRVKAAAQPAGAGPTGGGAVYGTDSASFTAPTGGAGQTPEQYAQFVADSIAMLDSTDPRQRFQAIINMTKMNPTEAVPLLEKATKNDNAQVVQLATRALTAMKQMPAGTTAAATPAVPTPATPAVPTPATPAVPTPAAPSATAGLPAVPTPATPATPAVPAAATPAVPTPATPATPAVPAAATPAVPTPAVPAPAPVAVPAPAYASYTGQSRDFATLYDALNYGSINEAIQAAVEMQAAAKDNRQSVVSALLNMIPATGFRRSDDVCIAAVSTLRQLQAKEALPFLQALVAQRLTDPALRSAAQAAIDDFKGVSAAAPAAATAATPAATPAAPAAAVPAAPAAPAIPATPAAPAAATVPATPAAPAAPAAAPTIPGFLKK